MTGALMPSTRLPCQRPHNYQPPGPPSSPPNLQSRLSSLFHQCHSGMHLHRPHSGHRCHPPSSPTTMLIGLRCALPLNLILMLTFTLLLILTLTLKVAHSIANPNPIFLPFYTTLTYTITCMYTITRTCRLVVEPSVCPPRPAGHRLPLLLPLPLRRTRHRQLLCPPSRRPLSHLLQ